MTRVTNDLGARIRAVRESAGLTLVDFAASLDIHDRTLSNYERDRRLPDSGFLVAVCEKYRITPAWLLLGERQEDIEPPAANPAEQPHAEGEIEMNPLGLTPCQVQFLATVLEPVVREILRTRVDEREDRVKIE